MVSRRARRSRGVSKLGCLLFIALFVGALYYGLDIGRVYWNAYKLRDEMKRIAYTAQTVNDEQMLKDLRRTVDELGLPSRAKNFRIRRGASPSAINIRTEYDVTIKLPFTTRTFHLKPEVDFK